MFLLYVHKLSSTILYRFPRYFISLHYSDPIELTVFPENMISSYWVEIVNLILMKTLIPFMDSLIWNWKSFVIYNAEQSLLIESESIFANMPLNFPPEEYNFVVCLLVLAIYPKIVSLMNSSHFLNSYTKSQKFDYQCF